MLRSATRVIIFLSGLGLATGCTHVGEGSHDVTEAAPSMTAPPVEEWAERISACLSEIGWEVKLEVDGSISVHENLDDRQFESDFNACEAETGYTLPRRTMNPDEAEEMWDRFLAAADCMRSLGFEVADPPSRADAVEALQQEAPIDLGWDPYAAVRVSTDVEAFELAFTECPPPLP